MSENNEAAFPSIRKKYIADETETGKITCNSIREIETIEGGLTKREYAAIKIIQAFCMPQVGGVGLPKTTAANAVMFADALLAELSKSSKED